LLKKSNPKQLTSYVDQYKWANFLLHPARYEAAGIVCGEAAAFGVPTITNSVGGLATTGKEGISGVVLQAGSPAAEYARVIEHYINNPDEYRNLCKSTRDRYEQQLNWPTAVNRIISRMEKVINSQNELSS